ncbi:hypothetical protein H2248_001524 [Termitomyces sp. 'cryptogamus']|nr:hypothetical protein H2248_001524 [Termitomyces sp. 'cryptogamus']
MHPTRELNLENIREDALHVEGESQLVEEGKTSNQAKITYPPESENNPRTLATSARRPLTRSQTGIKSTPALKRIKSASNKAVESSNMTTTKADTVVVPPPPRQISPSKDGHIHEPSITDTPITHPSSKLRANLPIPVPNLTKKSRGRRVPTKLGNDAGTPANPKDATRIYVCKVENCGKCFHRGEHLKRHIRSIHTHEKRESIRRAPNLFFTLTLNMCPPRLIREQPSSVHIPRVTSTSIVTTTYFNTSRSTETWQPLKRALQMT